MYQYRYVGRVIQVPPRYGLTIDRDEADAIDTGLAAGGSMEMAVQRVVERFFEVIITAGGTVAEAVRRIGV